MVDDVTITRPINIKLVTHARNKESSPLVSKNSIMFNFVGKHIYSQAL